jgi:hypothetical protein
MTSIDLETVRDEQLAFFLERTTGETARRQWETHVAAAIETWLETPLERLVTPEALARVVEALTTRDSFARAIRPLTKAIHVGTMRRLREESSKVGKFVPESAREKVEALVARPNRGAVRLLREVLAQEAMEETMRDVMFDALKEFNEKVNPFVADWGLPGIMKKLGPFGFGPLAKAVEGARKEFDRRLEPEMRKFLKGFSRRALDKTGDLMSKDDGLGKWDDLRKAVIRWIYDQEVRELMSDVDDEAAALAHGALLDVIEHTQALGGVRGETQRGMTSFFARHRGDPLRNLLAEYGGAPVFDARAIAEATWPAVKAILSSEPAANHIRKLLDEFWTSFSDSGPSRRPA